MAFNERKGALEQQQPLEAGCPGNMAGAIHPSASKLGTNQDDADMHRLGKRQRLNRNFHSLSILGLTCVVMGTWLGMITASTFSLINGGMAVCEASPGSVLEWC